MIQNDPPPAVLMCRDGRRFPPYFASVRQEAPSTLKWALLFIVLLALPGVANAQRTEVVVHDYSAARWGPLIADVTAELNLVMQEIPGAPLYVYELEALKSCSVVERRAKEGIAICTEPSMPGDADTRGGGTDRVLIRLEDSDVPFSYGRDLVCHEFVHAVTGQPDGPRDQDSCMRGPLSYFGSFDIAVMWEKFDALPAAPADPAQLDSDGDGILDADETALYGTDPANADSDVDGVADGAELAAGTDPLLADGAAAVDTDLDGLLDGDEASFGTDPGLADSDGDGWFDGEEIGSGTDPLDASNFPVS